MTIDDLVQVLNQIANLKPEPFNLPPDFHLNIKACPDCQGWAKDHPIQGGICDKHRQPLWDRERHEKYEAIAIGPRRQEIARKALDQFGRENNYPTR